MAKIFRGKKNIHAINIANSTDPQTVVSGVDIPYGMLVYFLRLQSCSGFKNIRLYTLVNSVYNELMSNNHVSTANTVTNVSGILHFEGGLYFPPKSEIYVIAGDMYASYSVSIYAYGLTSGD